MTNLQRQHAERCAGFGLIEVAFAVVLSSIGVLAAAAVSLGIGEQGRLARWDADQALAGRSALETVVDAGYASVIPGRGPIALGSRQYMSSTAVTTPAPRVKQVTVTIASQTGRAPAVFETRLAQPRPLPVAP